MKKLFFAFASILLLINSACDNNTSTETGIVETQDSLKEDNTMVVLDTAGMMEIDGIRVLPLKGSPEFSDAALEVNLPEENAKVKSGEVTFNYVVKNYQLKKQTPNPSCNQCNNSKDGQHIHLILNNEPYIAIYDTTYKKNLKDGQYVALSFLSRSYHESLKHFGAYDLRQFTVGKTNDKPTDLSKPLLFYSRPKGEYAGEFTQNILLDFYVLNTDLSANGKKVRATINGKEFLLNKWQPYVIQGLPLGESTVKLELIDENGELVDSPMNSIERKITLKQAAS